MGNTTSTTASSTSTSSIPPATTSTTTTTSNNNNSTATAPSGGGTLFVWNTASSATTTTTGTANKEDAAFFAATAGTIVEEELARDLSPHSSICTKVNGGSGRILKSYKMRHLKSDIVYMVKAFSTSSPSQLVQVHHPTMANFSQLSTSSIHILPHIGWFLGGNHNLSTTTTTTTTTTATTPTTNTIASTSATDTSSTSQSSNHNSTVTNSSNHNPITSTTNVSSSDASTTTTTTTSGWTSSGSSNKRVPVYLIRPHVYTTLADRMTMRPFLSHAEKLFLTFQLLKALEELHCTHKLVHGQLTCHNIGYTSIHLLKILDLIPRPVQFMESSDFITHCQDDTGKCYVAPERFGPSTDAASSIKLEPEMDMFSLGCCLLELHLDYTTVAMDLGDVMEYKKTGVLPTSVVQKLGKCSSSKIRAAIKRMLSLNPKERLTPSDYLPQLSHPSFTFLYSEILLKLPPYTHDARMYFLAKMYIPMIRQTLHITNDTQTQTFIQSILLKQDTEDSNNTDDDINKQRHNIQDCFGFFNPFSSSSFHNNMNNHPLDDETIQAWISETEALLQEIESPSSTSTTSTVTVMKKEGGGEEAKESSPPIYSEANSTSNKNTSKNVSVEDRGAFILYVQTILTTMRHVQKPRSKLVGLHLCCFISKHIQFGNNDNHDNNNKNSILEEIRLERMVPIIMNILTKSTHITPVQQESSMSGSGALVQATCIRTLTQVLQPITMVPPSNATLFETYLLPKLSSLLHHSNTPILVQVALAECMADLAEIALRFLDMSHALLLENQMDNHQQQKQKNKQSKTSSTSTNNDKNNAGNQTAVFDDSVTDLLGGKEDSSFSTKMNDDSRIMAEEEKRIDPNDNDDGEMVCWIPNDYESGFKGLQDAWKKWIYFLGSSSSSFVKMAVLKSLPKLHSCFFSSSSEILPQVLSVLNEKENTVLTSVLQTLPSMGIAVGRAATEQWMIPCMEITLCNPVTTPAALFCLSDWVLSGVFTTKPLLTGMLQKYAPLLLIPNKAIRHAYCRWYTSSHIFLKFPDNIVLFFEPILQPYLTHPIENSIATITSTNDDIEHTIECALIPPFQNWEYECQKISSHSGIADTTTIPASSLCPSSIVYHFQQYSHIIPTKETYDRIHDYMRSMVSTSRTITNASTNSASTGSDMNVKLQDFSIQKDWSISILRKSSSELPDWYQSLRHVVSTNETNKNSSMAQPESSLQSNNSIEQVYGSCSIGPTHLHHHHHNPTSHTKSNTRRFFLPTSVVTNTHSEGDESNILQQNKHGVENNKLLMENKEDAVNYLQSKKALNFDKATMTGDWSTSVQLDVSLLDTVVSPLAKIRALQVSPHSPPLGPILTNTSSSTSGSSEWKPKVDALMATCIEESGVNKLAVSKNFFVGVCNEKGKAQVYETQSLVDGCGEFSSSLTYHHGNQRLTDATIMEQHYQSVVTASSDGSVHVWRVDTVPTNTNSSSTPANSNTTLDVSTTSSSGGGNYYGLSRVAGSSVVRKVDPKEGEIMAVNHYATDTSSMIMFGTQGGIVHSWDLRSESEPFALKVPPEMGHLTCMALGQDRNWMVAGTSTGTLALWDLRFASSNTDINFMVSCWQHSSRHPINRLGTSKIHNPHVLLACGAHETCIFDISSSSIQTCFRILDTHTSYLDHAILPHECLTMPTLHRISIKQHHNITRGLFQNNNNNHFLPNNNHPHNHATSHICAMVGRMGSTNGHNYIITGGTDGYIRYWDVDSASKCYTVSGLVTTQPRPMYESIDFVSSDKTKSKLFLCRSMPTSTTTTLPNKAPQKYHKGLVRPENNHKDTIYDLKRMEYPIKALISSSRDGTIKIWR